jgi:hypothetical protein
MLKMALLHLTASCPKCIVVNSRYRVLPNNIGEKPFGSESIISSPYVWSRLIKWEVGRILLKILE